LRREKLRRRFLKWPTSQDFGCFLESPMCYELLNDERHSPSPLTPQASRLTPPRPIFLVGLQIERRVPLRFAQTPMLSPACVALDHLADEVVHGQVQQGDHQQDAEGQLLAIEAPGHATGESPGDDDCQSESR
jgi:hypothetical protein